MTTIIFSEAFIALNDIEFVMLPVYLHNNWSVVCQGLVTRTQ